MQQKAFIGKDSLTHLLQILQDYTCQNVLLVRGKGSYGQCGAKKEIDSLLCGWNGKIIEFYDFQENPKFEDMEQGLSLLQTNDIGLIIAVGGGSVLDMAKLLRFFYSYSGNPIGGEFKKERDLIPLVAMPTTAGTGCEATHFAVMYKDKVKYSVEHDDMLPDYAVVYPPFTYGNPKYLTACTGFDALAQAIEAYWNVNATEESDAYAEKAIDLLWENLPVAVNAPTHEVRDEVAAGAYWAGRAINITKTTAPHAFSYPFTSYYGYPHGHAVALTFPLFLDLFVKDSKSEKTILLSKINDDIYRLILNIGLTSVMPFDVNLILSNVNMQRLKNYPLEMNEACVKLIKMHLRNMLNNYGKDESYEDYQIFWS